MNDIESQFSFSCLPNYIRYYILSKFTESQKDIYNCCLVEKSLYYTCGQILSKRHLYIPHLEKPLPYFSWCRNATEITIFTIHSNYELSLVTESFPKLVRLTILKNKTHSVSLLYNLSNLKYFKCDSIIDGSLGGLKTIETLDIFNSRGCPSGICNLTNLHTIYMPKNIFWFLQASQELESTSRLENIYITCSQQLWMLCPFILTLKNVYLHAQGNEGAPSDMNEIITHLLLTNCNPLILNHNITIHKVNWQLDNINT